ncbi:subtilisin-like protease SBT4.15 [Chenopodium quinoa]|uniref:subtilisin-like protease SBT4.15 n=1 Tax=Chenopodium quinoa TaxID=63459 RepID=UPI000B799214|nr:subtilisin-like protease SBT4.15 [Chenopodium quinoa]
MNKFVLLLFFINVGVTLIKGLNDNNERKPYVVYMGESSSGLEQLTVESHHHNLLAETIGDESVAKAAKIHSYGRSLNGFAARLLPSEAQRLSEKSNVVSVFPSTIRKLLTTRSWDFLGMPENLKQRNLQSESEVIVGLLDTGIYVEAPSFNDEGYGPPPTKWKGKCDTGKNFTGCNRKVIGARYYNLGEDTGMEPTPVDNEGHGTHTASTAAGRSVEGASLYGVAKGTVRGGVPSGRIAMYKVCGSVGCSDTNILAAFDDAIADGVDIISFSIGGPVRNFSKDVLAIGSFHAMKKGILTVCAGGNDGPYSGTVGNVAPWVLTVAATNLDRQFMTLVELGNGLKFDGVAVNTYSPKKRMYPLTSSIFALNDTVLNRTLSPLSNLSTCEIDTLSKKKAEGKILLCLGYAYADYTVSVAHGAGAIIAADDPIESAYTTLIPASFVSAEAGKHIGRYINTTKSPLAVIHKTRVVHTTNAPMVASFSSRGPQTLAKNILKPDISAPGMDILAAFSKLAPITDYDEDKRRNVFNIITGTSMACPHVSGAAAYVKTFHPDWSPAAIKSALMTTAKPVNGKSSEDPLNSGAGLLNPVDAVHPGLVYDISPKDYIRYLCFEGYNESALSFIHGIENSKNHYNCSKFKQGVGADGLNYPSMHLQLAVNVTRISGVFHRTVTYVEHGAAVYKAQVTSPNKGVSIKVIPDVLVFTKAQQKKSFNVVVKGTVTDPTSSSTLDDWSDPTVYTHNSFLEWVESSSNHRVRSPIVIYRGHTIEKSGF